MKFYGIYFCVIIGVYIFRILFQYIFIKCFKSIDGRIQYTHERYNKYMIKYYDNIANENEIEKKVNQNINIQNKICKIIFFISLFLWIITIVIDILLNGLINSSKILIYLLGIFPVINMMTTWPLMEYLSDKKHNKLKQ